MVKCKDWHTVGAQNKFLWKGINEIVLAELNFPFNFLH